MLIDNTIDLYRYADDIDITGQEFQLLSGTYDLDRPLILAGSDNSWNFSNCIFNCNFDTLPRFVQGNNILILNGEWVIQ